ncbi:LysM peptidoglycan-binding domain-containing protein [bacterium]|nr:LysM peptidoglycan-binding domain-containing protein [bacterium]
MEFKDFWLKFDNNSSKELDLKSGVRRKDVSKDYHGIFDLYDSNKDGVLENKELANIFNTIKEKAGEDKVLDAEENASLSKFYSSMGLEVSMHDFVNALDEADNNIVGHEENEMADGSRQVMTSYADGTVESRTFYADGSSLTCVNDKPVQLIRQNNGKVVEELYYTYNDKTAIDNASVTIHKKSSSALGQVEIITVPNVNSDGQYDPEEITKVTKLDLVTNSYFILSKVEGKIYKEIPAVVDGSVVTIYNEYDLTNFDDYKEGESKASLQFMLDGEGNKYFVNYKDDCTIFHAKNGETIDSICKDFNIPKEDLLKLNPSLATNGNIKVGDEIRVKGTFEVNSPLLKGRNNPEGEFNVYMRAFYKNKVVENISIHNKERIKLDKDYANLNDLATAILYKQGKNPKPEDVEIFAISLSVLNPELRVEDLKKIKN